VCVRTVFNEGVFAALRRADRGGSTRTSVLSAEEVSAAWERNPCVQKCLCVGRSKNACGGGGGGRPWERMDATSAFRKHTSLGTWDDTFTHTLEDLPSRSHHRYETCFVPVQS